MDEKGQNLFPVFGTEPADRPIAERRNDDLSAQGIGHAPGDAGDRRAPQKLSLCIIFADIPGGAKDEIRLVRRNRETEARLVGIDRQRRVAELGSALAVPIDDLQAPGVGRGEGVRNAGDILELERIEVERDRPLAGKIEREAHLPAIWIGADDAFLAAPHSGDRRE